MSGSKKPIGVVGAGTMGSGIAQVFAATGFRVTLVDVEQRFLDRGLERVSSSLDRLVKKNTLAPDSRDAIRDRITTSTDRNALAEHHLVVEAIVEKLEAKRDLFQELGRILPEEALLASNTSSISITELATASGRPDCFIGMHFMNPVPLMNLVEVIRGQDTSETTFQEVMNLARALGKTPVAVNDYPGFVSNRVLLPMINEAIFSVMEGVAEPEAIDTVMKLGMNHPMGPLQLADFIGLDVCLDILNVLQGGLGDPKYRPCPLLKRMVAAGHLGRKSGRGFYTYGKGS